MTTQSISYMIKTNQKLLEVQKPFLEKVSGRWRHLFLLFFFLLPFGLLGQGIDITGNSSINQCETNSYTIELQNNSGNTLSNLVIVARLENLTGFSYVTGTSYININGGGNSPLGNPTVSGAYTGGCAAPVAPYLTWDIDALLGNTTLLDGQRISITFDLQTDCDAVSGSLNTIIDYEISGTPMCDNTGVLNIQVNPGAVTIKKTPNVVARAVGDTATWTLTIENTGFGVIKNVIVTDELGAGLTYVSCTNGGVNSGQTTTWDSSVFADLAEMDPGDIITMDITAQVVQCQYLDNVANVRWGCDAVTDCFNTADDGGTATASVQRIVTTPLIDYTAPDITFNYCEDYVDVSFTISNIGDGRAHDVWTVVDFSPMTVSNVSAGTTYNVAEHRFEHTDPIEPGGSYELSFRLNYAAWCGATFPAKDILWQKVYEDDCHQKFYPPVEMSVLNPPVGAVSLALTKSGAGSVIQIGDVITYTITSSYTGPLTCGNGGNVGTITVVDTIPDGFVVTDADGGTYVPGGNGTGGTITWTYLPPTTLSKTITVQSPLLTECETYCNTVFTNNVSATGVDCCGCSLSASASETSAIECAEGVTSAKSASSPIERCGDVTYTNTYTFDSSSAVTLNSLVFTEHADNEQLYNNNLSVTLDGVDITGSVIVTDTTGGVGGTVVINFSGAPATNLANRVLIISYHLTATAETVAACSGGSFYSWSSLGMGASGSSCLGDGVIHETTQVNVGVPAMSLSITGLGAIFHKCQTQTITLTLTQTSVANPKDVKLKLSGLNYYVINPTDPGAVTCSGDVAPVSCLPTIDGNGDYVWTFNDGFTGQNQQAVIQLTVQKRCTGSGDLVSTAYFDDLCTDDGTADELCSVSATETPTLLLSGDLLIEKTPEVYYATTNTVQWVIYLTNRGTGTAYNVWVDDVLGAGLRYTSAVVDDMTGVVVTGNLDHSSGVINGANIAITDMTAGERRMITFTAEVIDCDNLTNQATASWGCIGLDCQVAVTDTSSVKIPAPNLINTNTITPSGGVNACATPNGYITLRNAGQVTCYNLQVTETLPAGLSYVSGTTRWRLNGGAWNGPHVDYDPIALTSPLVWTKDEISGLETANPADTIEIEFQMVSNCPFAGGDITVSTRYENPCADVFTNAASKFTVAFNEPDITITKTRVNEPIDCDEEITWDITVTNNSGYMVPIIWVEDTMDAAYRYVSSLGEAPYTTDNGTNVLQTVTWELENIPHGTTVTLHLTARTDTGICSPDLDNTVQAWWGCGNADGSSATKPGEDAPDNNLCLGSTGVSAVRTETRQPTVGYMNVSLSPASIDSCDDDTEMTVVLQNTGNTAAKDLDLVVTLPTGLSYNANSSSMYHGIDDSGATGPIGDPNIVGNVLTFYNVGDRGTDLVDTLEADGGNDTIVLKFSVTSSCYTTANVALNLRYYDCCGLTQYSTTSNPQVTALFPTISVTKTPDTSETDCNDDVTWTVVVSNTGTGNAQVVRVEDTMGAWLTYVPGSFTTPDKPGTNIVNTSGNIWAWEINDLAAGTSATFTLDSTVTPVGVPNQADCATDALRQNSVRAIWGCGTAGDAVDNNPSTTSYDCTHSAWSATDTSIVQMPDLVATAITPAITCNSDGSFTGSITVTVRNQGSGTTHGGFTVSVTDGTWTGTGTYAGTLDNGSSTTVTIDVTGWNPDCSPCSYNFTATVDSTNAVCECDESNNIYVRPTAYSPSIPDIEVASEALNITCTSDGNYRVSGTVTIRNNGCSGTLTTNIPMRFTLHSGTGCSGAQVDQWTQTFSSVSIAAGATQTFTITNRNIAGNAVTSASSCNFSILTEADYSNTICECDGTDNSLCSDETFTIPDLRVDSDTLAITCNADGQIRISGNIVVANDGCDAPPANNFTTNIPIRVRVYNDNDDCNTATFGTITTTLTGVSIPFSGGTQTFAFNQTLTRNLCTQSTSCAVAIGVELDYTNTICESNNSNNTYCAINKAVSIPDLQVSAESLAVNCLADGQVRVSGNVTLANNGCSAAVSGNVEVRFTLFTNTGCTGTQVAQWTETFSGANIAAGGTQVFTLTNRDITTNIVTNSTSCQVSLRVEVDPNSAICECDGTNNSLCSAAKTVSAPDLRITSVTPTISCTNDGSLTGSVAVVVNNNGCGTASSIPVRLASDCGVYTFTDQTITSLAAGASTTLTYTFTPNISNCTCTFTATADPDSAVCESDGTNNSRASSAYTSSIPDLTITDIDFTGISCDTDGVDGSVAVTVRNAGCGTASNFQVSLTTDGCLSFNNQTVVSLAAGASTTLTFNVSGSWADCNDTTCSFTARVDQPGTVCEYDGTNNSRSEDFTPPISDLEATSVSASTSCSADGTITGTITVNVSNIGNSVITDDFRISVNDGQGWSDELYYHNDLGGTLPLAIGANDSVDITWDRDFTATPRVCNFTTISATVDSQGEICECTNSNNTDTTSYTMTYPNVNVVSVTPTCSSDGTYSIDVEVTNDGCGTATNVAVRLSDNDSHSSTQNVTLTSGQTSTLTFASWPTDGNPAALVFTATVDPTSAICELNGDDHSEVVTHSNPNLTIASITPSCTTDGTFQVSVVIENTGNGNVTDDFVVRLSDNDGHTVNENFTAIGGTLPLTAGTQQTVVFGSWTVDGNPTTINFTGTVDTSNQVCESNNSDNGGSGTFTVNDLRAVSMVANTSCASDGSITGTIAVTLTNTGGNAITNDFSILVDDGQGWTSELLYNGNLGGTLPLAAGSSATVTFDWTRDFSATPYVCSFSSISATVDSQGDWCEVTNTNNSASCTYSMPYPNLRTTGVTPTCNSDGTYSIAVTVNNNGCGTATNVVVRLSDDDSHSSEQTVTLTAGQSRTLTFSSWPVDGNPAALTFTATIDPDDAICELTDPDSAGLDPNHTIITTFNNPNLHLVSITPTCTADTSYRVDVVVENNGSAAVNSDFVVRLSDNDGHSVDRNFTAIGGSLPLNAGTQQTVSFTNWTVDCSPTTINFSGTLDPTDQICESNSSDDTGTGSMIINNLQATSVVAATNCASDGSISGTMTVTLTNAGGNAINSDFRILVDDGRGWTSELWYQDDLGGTLPIAVGASSSVTFNWTRNFTASPYVLTFPSITATIDSQSDICECNSVDNATTTTYTLPYPDLTIVTVASSITCLGDGSLTGTTVTVSNTGGATATNVVVRLASDCGLTFTDQTITLAAGASTDVFFPFTSGINNCACNFSATIDPENAICELDGTNNSGTSSTSMLMPDLEVQSENLLIACTTDGVFRITGTVTLVNNGCGPNFTTNIPMRFTLFSNTGCSGSQVAQWTESFSAVNIASSGGTQTFTIQPHDVSGNFTNLSTNCMVSIRMEADYNNTICEWDGTDNSLCTDKTSDCLDVEAVSINANTVCVMDGNFTRTLAFTIRNSGGKPITRDFSVKVDDGHGWSVEKRYNADLGGPLPLPAGDSATVTFNWNRTLDTTTCDFGTITAWVDTQNEICQGDTNNDMITTSYEIPYANLKPTAIVVSCSADGYYTARVTVTNDGCADCGAGNFTLRLQDNLGNVFDQVISTGILPKGASYTVEFSQWPATCDPDEITFTAIVDTKNTVCEIRGDDNQFSYAYKNQSPDLVITSLTPAAVCSSPGMISGSMTVTLLNQGNGPVTQDFKVICDDGAGWTTEKYYAGDLGGSLPIAANDTIVLRIPWNRDFTRAPFTCNFNNIHVRLDVQTGICECKADNNETTATYSLPFTDLKLDALTVLCQKDGQKHIQFTVGNEGCEDQRDDFTITISDNVSGQSKALSFTALGGKLPLSRGTTQTIIYTQWSVDCTATATQFKCSLGAGSFCDLRADNNTVSNAQATADPDLLLENVDWTCNNDGSITFRVLVANIGASNASNVPFSVYDHTSKVIYNRTLNLTPGEHTQFAFTTSPYPGNTALTFRFILDEIDIICECNGANNEKVVTVNCTGGNNKPVLEISKICPPGQQPGGLFRFEIHLTNTSQSDLRQLVVEDYLPGGFQYVRGSTVWQNRSIGDPQITDHLLWTIDLLSRGETGILLFNAVANADIAPGQYCNTAQAKAHMGDLTGIEVNSGLTECCVVVSRENGLGCCLHVEEWAMTPFYKPDAPLSLIEPYFRTESSMFTVYSIYKLWKGQELEKESLPLFIRERLHNYARSTIEEFYLHSRLGLTLDDHSLWLSAAGAYPEQNKANDTTNAWVHHQVDETMTLSQMAFELLALNEAVGVETNNQVKQQLHTIIQKKLTFLGGYLEKLPHAWEIKLDKTKEADIHSIVRDVDGEATLYDRVALYLAMIELQRGGYVESIMFEQQLRPMLKSLDNTSFDRNNRREEFLFILALVQSGQDDAREQAKAKMKNFSEIFANDKNQTQETNTTSLDRIADYALAIHLDRCVGGTRFPELLKQLQEKYYLHDTGIYAHKQPDFTYKLELADFAPLILAFDTTTKEEQEQYAKILYRTFDEVGLFLKKRNLMEGNPLYSLLRNYPFAEPVLPVLSFTKAKQNIAPVFSRDAVVHSTLVKPLGEILVPGAYTKILSPVYETATARVAAISYALQHLGSLLVADREPVVQEEGRSLSERGKAYMDSLLVSGAGLLEDDHVLIPFDTLAIKGPKQGEFNLEPLNAGITFSSETLANYLLAERQYIANNGKHAEMLQQKLVQQWGIVTQLVAGEQVPLTFQLFFNPGTQQVTVLPASQVASKVTVAKFFHLIADEKVKKQLSHVLKKTRCQLEPVDLLFLVTAPELVSYFRDELNELVAPKDASLTSTIVDVLARQLLGQEAAKIQPSLAQLAKLWDKQAVIPISDHIENIEKGLIYHHTPDQFMLYLLAMNANGHVYPGNDRNAEVAPEFRFKRTLNLFTYLLENEWGIKWDKADSFITLPSVDYQVFKEEPRENVQPGDRINFRVRVDNTCPEGIGSGRDLSSLYLKAAFTPSLIYVGTQAVEGLDFISDFQWRYNGFPTGSWLEYVYQAFVPNEFTFNYIDGTIYAGGRQGLDEQTNAINDCEDLYRVRRFNILPYEELQGLVYEDRNVNGVKDVNEPGIPNILFKDTRGRMFRSDAEGRFTVVAGDEHEGVQMELRSVPANFLLLDRPTKLVNRHYTGMIYFGLIPCKTVEGFVYEDENQNNTYDVGEKRPAGVVLKAKDKEVVTGVEGKFMFRNLPVLWQEWIEIKKDQPFYKEGKSLKIQY